MFSINVAICLNPMHCICFANIFCYWHVCIAITFICLKYMWTFYVFPYKKYLFPHLFQHILHVISSYLYKCSCFPPVHSIVSVFMLKLKSTIVSCQNSVPIRARSPTFIYIFHTPHNLMGVDISCYRARVGIFFASYKSESRCNEE